MFPWFEAARNERRLLAKSFRVQIHAAAAARIHPKIAETFPDDS
jgi:hypothetical protein